MTKMTDPSESLPRRIEDLESLATYYDTNDTSSEMDHGEWVDPRPMQTTSLRLPVDTVTALKAIAQARGVRYTALLRELVEDALKSARVTESKKLDQINKRLAKIEAAISGRGKTQAKKSAVVRKSHYNRTFSNLVRQQEDAVRKTVGHQQGIHKAAARMSKVAGRRAASGKPLT